MVSFLKKDIKSPVCGLTVRRQEVIELVLILEDHISECQNVCVCVYKQVTDC